MRKIVLIVAMLFLSAPAMAQELQVLAGYDHYFEPNKGNNYDDAWGFTIGLEHGFSGNLKGQAKYLHITDIDFPSVDDPKGSWGELRGHVAMYALKYDLPYNDRIGFYVTGGAGIGFWDFRENPFLQDAKVTVDVKNSLVLQAGVGASANIGQGWSVNVESGWLNTDIDKHISENDRGIENIIDAGDIGIQYIPVKVYAKKKF